MNKAKEKFVGRQEPFTFTIMGEPASKANSRRLVRIGGTSRLIKSKKALGYCDVFIMQCPVLDPLFTGDVCVTMTITYASRRPDLDESLILDLMQDRIYANDRQVKKKIITWALDRERPMTSCTVSLLK